MNDRVTLTGIVLSVSPIGEYDKRLVLLTRERGKITAFAKGARRPGSILLAAANPFVFGKFTAFEGRNSYRLVQAEVQNYFREMAQDMELACYGSYFLEVADYYTRENADELPMLKLVYTALLALQSVKLDNRLVRYVFELKAMVINGEYPQAFSCVCCGREDELAGFLPQKNGVLCSACAAMHKGSSIPLLPSTIYTLQYVIATPIEKLFCFGLSSEVMEEFAQLLSRFCSMYRDKEFKSLDILRTIANY